MYIRFEDIDFTSDVFDKISIKLLKEIRLIPFYEDKRYVHVLKDSEDLFVQDNIIKLIYNKEIKYEYITKDDFERVLNYLEKSSIQGFYENILQTSPEQIEYAKLGEEKEEFYNKEIKSSYIVRTIDNLIEKAILQKVSDIHFEPKNKNVIVRFRIDGDLVKSTEFSQDVYQMIVSRIKILSKLDITKHQEAQDGKFVFKYNGEDYDIRISILPTLYGERLSLRILDDEANNYTFDDLYIDKNAKSSILKILEDQVGLILVVGPTGSGKTTTLYSLLKEKINEKINIITVEDPIEYSIDGVSQVQVNNNGLGFTETLKTVLRQDPDVFMIGEIRDEESASIAIRSATTGHLVLSTIHASDAETSISRLIDLGVPPFLIATSLKAIIFQKLVKKRCNKCKKEVIVNNKKEFINEGCPVCNNTGLKGRICLGEVLIIDEELKSSIISQNYEFIINEQIKSKKFIKLSTILKRAEKEGLIKK